MKYEWTSGDDADTWEQSAASATDSTLSAHHEASAEYLYHNSTGWSLVSATDKAHVSATASIDWSGSFDQTHAAGDNSFAFHSDDAGHEELDAHYDHNLTSYPTGDSTPPTGTISWGSTGSGHQTGNITGEFSSSYTESGDPPFTFTVSGDYLSQASNTYAYSGAWGGFSGGSLGGSSSTTSQYQFSWYGTHTENGTGWQDGDSYDGTGTSEQRWTDSRLQGATGYDEAALASLVPGVIMGGAPGIGGPSHAPQTIGFALPPGLGLGDDNGGGNQDHSPADEVVFEDFDAAWWNGFWSGGGFITGGKAIANAAVDALVSFSTLGLKTSVELIPVDPNTDIGYDSSYAFARIGTEALLAAATCGASAISKVGMVLNAIDTAGNLVQGAQGLKNIINNGFSLPAATQVATGLLGVGQATKITKGAIKKAPSKTAWPPNRGFADPPGRSAVLPGAKLDRYGSPSGSFLSPAGTPFAARALPPGAASRALHTYEVVRTFEVDAGRAAAWFNQPGGGIQFDLGTRTVQDLIDGHFLRILE